MAKSKTLSDTITWKESAGIEQAVSLKKELLSAFDANQNVHLDISSVQDIDTSAIQIILAAAKEAEKQGKTFSITGTVPAPILQIIKTLNITLPGVTNA